MKATSKTAASKKTTLRTAAARKAWAGRSKKARAATFAKAWETRRTIALSLAASEVA